MGEIQVSIRDVDKEIFNEFKVLTIKKRMKIGQALTMAMMEFLNEELEIPKKSLMDMKTSNWGKGTEKTSEEIDKMLYGG
ncbi:MAG: hypothetical protein WD876_03710 [Candidatus Pacearchaeota archaeon]